ncbi:NADH dehydrogenase [ubiquinone] 1 alpha subcomplex assembly factor 2 [Aplochiton taeniatus]
MSRISGLLRRTFGIMKDHVGTDLFGNKYYQVPEQKTWTGRIVRAKRMVVASNPTEFEYLEGNIPSEWDAWIRGRRKQPPSIEELMKNQVNREQIKNKAQDVEKKELALQAKEYEEGLVARPSQTIVQGHASAISFGRQEISAEPTSTANTFQPGSWTPTAKK